ncbi:MAG: HAMP domain-containing histidine kinase [Alphaproteobacteria bacterium]|nr:HAMP domain-containing histidine kinase [Alphaproteobacteria bacterium]
MFRLLRYFSIANGIALLAVGLVLVVVYRQTSFDGMVEAVEHENVALSRALANTIWPRFADYVKSGAPDAGPLLRSRSESTGIDSVIRKLTMGLNVIKVRLYRRDGLIVYSSDFSEMGTVASQDTIFARSVIEGRPASKVSMAETITGISGNLKERRIVESYLPITGSDGTVEGVFELYSDTTDKAAAITRRVTFLSIGLVWAFGLLYGLLFIIVRRADMFIKRQYYDLHQDVSDRLESEGRLLDTLEQVEHANTAKSQFLAHMSHELRTPLNSIIGFSEVMAYEVYGKIGNPQYLEYAGDIHHSGMYLLKLINEILDLSKIEAGAMEINEQTIDLAEAMRECEAMLKDEARKIGINLVLSMPDDLPNFQGDPLRLKQIFLNLLSNALKFTPAGGTITLDARQNETGEIQISVADSGIGIAAEDLNRILLPFEQAEGFLEHSDPGTGLGLALTKSLTELHGGRLSLTSDLGVGTTVTLNFPAVRALAVQPELPLVQ